VTKGDFYDIIISTTSQGAIMTTTKLSIIAFTALLFAGCTGTTDTSQGGESTTPPASTPTNTSTQTTGTSTSTSTSTSTQTNTPTTDTSLTQSQLAVKRHNEIRAEVYSGFGLVWSDTVAASAQKHADYLGATNTFDHGNSPYGENLYASGGNATYVDAINSWHEEKADFNPQTKECYGEWYECGHYTQLIWQETTEVGCGKSSSSQWDSIIVCQYNPPGNYTGESPY